jgi:hypothetical protein
MATYNAAAVADGSIAHKKPITLQQGRTLRDNPLAIAEGADNAPYVAAQWHPHDGVLVADANDGLIYDFAVTGAVASVETPDFEDGFEYRLLFVGVSFSVGSSVPQIELYRATSTAWSAVTDLSAATFGTSQGHSGFLDIMSPRVSQRWPTVTGALGQHYCGAAPDLSGAQKTGKARFKWSSDDIRGGKIYLYRRKCWLS